MNIIERIKDRKQKYLEPFLTAPMPKKLQTQLEQMDWSCLDKIHQKTQERGEICPLGAMELPEIKEKEQELRKKGIEAIQQHKIAAVLLAGGQGTRLGFDKAKGMYNIGVTKDLYIFEQLAENLKKVTKEAGCFVPLCIMTSEKNDAQTRAFWKEHDFFGYEPEMVKFFIQEMVPAVDFDGNILMEAEDSLGGWFVSMQKAGLVEELKAMGVEWINIFAVDNVLQQIADPVFVGATLESNTVCGAKVVRKADPYERVGAICLENGRPSIVEYYELSKEMAEQVNEQGTLSYGFGVILNYLFSLGKLEEIAQKELPVHVVEKKVPYVDEHGILQKPQTPNAYKFETLVVDMIYLMDTCLVFEVEREKEFAPIKNPTGIDSVESARELLLKNGITV